MKHCCCGETPEVGELDGVKIIRGGVLYRHAGSVGQVCIAYFAVCYSENAIDVSFLKSWGEVGTVHRRRVNAREGYVRR